MRQAYSKLNLHVLQQAVPPATATATSLTTSVLGPLPTTAVLAGCSWWRWELSHWSHLSQQPGCMVQPPGDRLSLQLRRNHSWRRALQVTLSRRESPGQHQHKAWARIVQRCAGMRCLTCQIFLQERLIRQAGAVGLEAGWVETQAWHRHLIVSTVFCHCLCHCPYCAKRVWCSRA